MGRIENQWWLYCRCHLEHSVGYTGTEMANLGQQTGGWGLVLIEFCPRDGCDWGIQRLLVLIGTLSKTLGDSYKWTIGLVRFSSPASTGHISAWVLECGEWLLELAEEVEVRHCWSLRRGYPMDVFG
jgi:hypothetical protein